MPTGNTLLIVFALYLLAIYFLSSLKPVYVSFRKVYLFRCLFPSWKFYEDLSYLPILYYRTSEDGSNFGGWTEGVEALRRNWARLFINADGNLCHAYNSLLQQLEADKEGVREEDKDELVQSVSYRLTKNLVLLKLRQRGNQKKYFQFKLTLEFQGDPSNYQDILISIVHEV